MAELSICMIVRDEARQLPGCLDSLTHLSAELIIVDTGSVDDTVEIANSYGAKVYHFDWVDDFSAARNESLIHTTGDWRLWLDADERFDVDTADLLSNLPPRASRPTIYQVKLRNHQVGGQHVTYSMSHRLISHHAAIRFSGNIHEQVSPSLRAAGGVELPSDVVLDHYGYALPPDEMDAKLRRNQALLLMAVQADPKSSYAHFTLGQNYAQTDEPENALASFLEALAIGGFRGLSKVPLLNNLAETCWKLGRLDEGEMYARESIKITDNQTGGHFDLYRIMAKKGDISGQIASLEKVLLVGQNAQKGKLTKLAQDIVINPEITLLSLGNLYLAAQDVAAGEKALRSCLAIDPGMQGAITLLISSLAAQNKWDDIPGLCERIEKPLSDQQRDLHGVALIKLERFDDAINHYHTWYDEQSQRPEIGKKLAGLYAKVGRVADAEALLIALGNNNP
jgi:tetratricopeptide (TPR) repeat protein